MYAVVFVTRLNRKRLELPLGVSMLKSWLVIMGMMAGALALAIGIHDISTSGKTMMGVFFLGWAIAWFAFIRKDIHEVFSA
jgi:hypothetical protein